MGLCHEFGSQIRNGCSHPMRAGASACSCAECGVVCRGLFDGCPDVWARGPRPVTISATRASATNGAPSAPAAGPSPRPEPVKATGTATATGGSREAGVPEARGAEARGAEARGAEARGADAGTIAYLEAPPVALGPGIVGRAGTDARGATRGAGESRRGTDPGAVGRDESSAKSDHGRDAPGDPRREVFRWFEEAFEGVRSELQALIGSMTHQQAMLAELLDSRQAELRLALVAESLPDLVADAVRAAMDEHTSAMAGSFESAHDRFRDDVDQIRVDTAATVESLSESVQKLTDAIAVHDEEAEQREAVRLGTLKGSVTRQITPLADALAHLAAQVDALSERVGDSGRSAPARVARPAPAAATPVLKGLAANRSASKAAPPAVGQRVSSPRMKRTGATAGDPPAVAAPAARRVATARVATPAPPADESESRTNGAAAAPVTRRVATGRVVTGRSAPPTRPPAAARVAPSRPAAPARVAAAAPGASRPATAAPAAAPARVATGARPAAARPATARPAGARPEPAARVPTARVAAARASDDAVAEEPVTAPVARVLTRRRPAAPVQEPLVTYELERDDDPDDDDDAGWTPPAWVSAVARERAGQDRRSPAQPATRSGTTRGRPTR